MDETVWHRHDPIWPLWRDEKGRLIFLFHNGKVWRRRVNGRWQYRQDEETDEEWTERQW